MDPSQVTAELLDNNSEDLDDNLLEGGGSCPSDDEDVSYYAEEENDDGGDRDNGIDIVRTNVHLSTIAEESQLPENSISKWNSSAIAHTNFSKDGVFGEPQTSEAFASADFVIGGNSGLQLQKDEEAFYSRKFLDKNDCRFNKTHQEKEFSWEPSVPDNTPPLPIIQKKTVLDEVDASLCQSVNSLGGKPKEETLNAIDGKLNVPKEKSKGFEGRTFSEPMQPKVSTPNAEVESRKKGLSLSSNFYDVSAILPANNTTACWKDKLSAVPEETMRDGSQRTLTSSAIGDALSNTSLTDSGLIAALLKAKSRPKGSSINSKFELKQKRNKASKKDLSNITNGEDVNFLTTSKKTSKVVVDDNPLSTRSHRFSGTTLSNSKSPTEKLEVKTIPNMASTDSRHLPSKASNSRFSSRSCSSLLSGDDQSRVLSVNPGFLYFGFADLSEKFNKYIRLRNVSSGRISLTLHLKSKNGFELSDEGAMALDPQECREVRIIFQPKQLAHYRNALKILVLNAKHLKYSVSLVGYGGAACLEVVQSKNISMLRDGSYAAKLQGGAYVAFDVKNRGFRDAFLRIIVKDQRSGKPVQKVRVTPSDCATILRQDSQLFEVHLENDLLNHLSGRQSVSSSLSSISSSALPYSIHLVWGQEAQRRRLKGLEELSKKEYLLDGLSYTKPAFLNEERSHKSVAEGTVHGEFDFEAFQFGLRMTTISVIDNRFAISTNRLSEYACPGSVLLDPDETFISAFADKTVIQDVSIVDKKYGL